MKPLVLLLNNYFLALLFVFGFINEISSCDTKWIRYVYLLSCGKKKRESVPTFGSFNDTLPLHFEGALKYLKDRDPTHPIFTNEALLNKILKGDDEKTVSVQSRVPKLILTYTKAEEKPTNKNKESVTTTSSPFILINKLIPRTAIIKNTGIQGFPDQWNVEEKTEGDATDRTAFVLIDKLFPKTAVNKTTGIQGFPDQWDIDEIMDDKINENRRREIDHLIEECCKVPPVTTCNLNTFLGACK